MDAPRRLSVALTEAHPHGTCLCGASPFAASPFEAGLDGACPCETFPYGGRRTGEARRSRGGLRVARGPRVSGGQASENQTSENQTYRDQRYESPAYGNQTYGERMYEARRCGERAHHSLAPADRERHRT